jgi:dTDP-glucose 4,6-dehydratase
LYGEGENVRDWLFVRRDHATAIDACSTRAPWSETYGGGVNEVGQPQTFTCSATLDEKKTGREKAPPPAHQKFVTDRAGHDLRYAIDSSKIALNELGWKPSVNLRAGLRQTVVEGTSKQNWLNNVTSGSYQDYYQKQFGRGAYMRQIVERISVE